VSGTLDSLQRLYGRLSVAGSVATDHRRLASVDLVRATAAVSVLLSHAYAYPLWSHPAAITRARYLFTATLTSGVFLFFALSGYLIAGPYLRSLARGREFPSTPGYAVRRAVRILPAWWVALAAVILLTEPAIKLWQLVMHATLTFGPDVNESSRYLSIGWTLGAEMAFYVFVPIAALLARNFVRHRQLGVNRLVAALVGLWLVSSAWTFVAALGDPLRPGTIGFERSVAHTGFGVIGGLFHFMPGMLVFVLLLAPQELVPPVRRAVAWGERRTFSLFGVAAVLWMAAVAGSHDGQSEAHAALMGEVNALACGLILFAVLTGAEKFRTLVVVAAPVGLVSYGVYLWHGVLVDSLSAGHASLGFLTGNIGPLGFGARSILLFAFAVILGTLSWLGIERPLLRWTTGWERQRRTIETAAPAPVDA